MTWLPVMKETPGGDQRQDTRDGKPLWRLQCNCRLNGAVRWGSRMAPHNCCADRCRHLGEKQTEIPGPCCGSVETVFACDVFGSCTLLLVDNDIRACDGCDKKEA